MAGDREEAVEATRAPTCRISRERSASSARSRRPPADRPRSDTPAIVGRWERALVTVAEEHLATSVSEIVLAEPAGRLPRGQALATGADLHAGSPAGLVDALDERFPRER